jgi:8-oxo-dGTP pyrophosphatase MutT (NUDIX family)
MKTESINTEVATVVFLITGNQDKKICLAKKKLNVHSKDGKELKNSATFNGYGGKREEEDVSIRDTATRELFDESGVVASPRNLIPAGNIRFYWPDNSSDKPNMDVFFFFLATFEGDPKETNEMGSPEFFEINKIPFEQMLPADRIFLPKMLVGEKVVADVFFGKKDENGLPSFIIKDEELIV